MREHSKAAGARAGIVSTPTLLGNTLVNDAEYLQSAVRARVEPGKYRALSRQEQRLLRARSMARKENITSEGALSLMRTRKRNPWTHRCRELIRAHLSDMGGASNVSVAQQSLIRRAAALEIELEFLEHNFACAGSAPADALSLYTKVTATLIRILEVLGVQRVARDITNAPRLADLLSREIEVKATRQDDDGDEDEGAGA